MHCAIYLKNMKKKELLNVCVMAWYLLGQLLRLLEVTQPSLHPTEVEEEVGLQLQESIRPFNLV